MFVWFAQRTPLRFPPLQLRPAAWNCYIVCEKLHQQLLPASIEPHLRHDVALLHFALDSHLDGAEQLDDHHQRSSLADGGKEQDFKKSKNNATRDQKFLEERAQEAEDELLFRSLDDQLNALGSHAPLPELDALLERVLAHCTRRIASSSSFSSPSSSTTAINTGIPSVSACRARTHELDSHLQLSLLSGLRGQRRQRLLLGVYEMLRSIRQQLAQLQV